MRGGMVFFMRIIMLYKEKTSLSMKRHAQW